MAASVEPTLFGEPRLFEEPTVTVAELSRGIGTALARAFPDEVWVRGEIADLTRPASGHVYFSLVGDGACVAVTLWASDRQVVNQVLRRASGTVRMTDGTEVRIRARVQWYPKRGTVQLRMLSIDTAYTLGRLAEDRDRLVRVLEAEGLLGRQRALTLSLVPLRVGLVTSDGSAAAADFLHTLEASAIGWQVTLADTRVQGPAAEDSLIAGLRLLAGSVDVICLVRGGGARTDLAAFDRERVARAIAGSPVPVLTGVGHETDTTVADLVAHASFKTPTACAGFLVDRVGECVRRWAAAWQGVERSAVTILGRAERRLHRATGRAAGAGRRHLHSRGRDLDGVVARLQSRPDRILAGAGRHVDGLDARLQALDPARVLARGWTITRDEDGRLLRTASTLTPGDRLVTTFVDGPVTSRVERQERSGEG